MSIVHISPPFPSRSIGALLTSLLLGLSPAACSDSEPGPETRGTTLVSLGLQKSPSLSVELLGERAPTVGLNRLYYRLTRLPGGEPVLDADITHTPIMHMATMGMEHSCPFEVPPKKADDDGLFEAAVVFQMAAGDASSGNAWRVEAKVDTGDGTGPEEFVFGDLPVGTSDARRDLALTDSSGATTAALVTFTFDAAPRVGQNTFTVTVHHKTDMHGMAWAPDDDFAITATPDMPSMGHGSTMNVDPIHVGAGRYEGSLNFTMPGLWRVLLGFSRGGTSVGTLEYTFDL